ncbi:MAG: DUF4290 domain-containing protein [Bacteroidetes bacterium]|nr:DUF4290 domain-containing protein [Bacteroidota bacterium]
MDYNSSRPKLQIREYGRNVQNLVNHISTLKDKSKRTALANQVIELMAQMNPFQKHNPEFEHKLWDHIVIISDFKLDVDNPFPMPTKQTYNAKPSPLPYPQKNIRFRHYGRNIELMNLQAIDMPEGDKKKQYIRLIVNYMKMAYQNWHRENISDESILADLESLSNGKLTINKDEIPNTVYKPPTRKRTQSYSKRGGSSSSRNNSGRRSNSNRNNSRGYRGGSGSRSNSRPR